MNKDKNTKPIWDYIFAFIIFAVPFIHVNTGVALSDPLYNLSNYERFPHFNQTWMISTLLANLTGKLMTLLPGGHTMLGMSIYCIAFTGLLSVGVYLLVRRFFKPLPSFVGVLIGVVLCWCPRVILYHYMTYLLFDIAALILMLALTKGKKYLCVVAGVVLAVNTFVRFPNIVEVALIVVVFAYGIIYRKHIIKEFGLCVAGYVGTFGIGFLLINLCLGNGSYMSMINGLFSMTDKAQSYKPTSMVLDSLLAYKGNFIWFMLFVILAAAISAVYGFIRKRITKYVLVATEAVAFVAIVFVMKLFGIVCYDYTLYSATYALAMFLVFMAAIIFIVSLFSKKYSKEYKLMGVTVMLIVAITPLGSNNAFYSVLNNMFLVGAYVVGMIFEGGFIKEFKSELIDSKSDEVVAKFQFSFLPAMGLALAICLFTLFQGVMFTGVFVFRDLPFYSKDYVMIKDGSNLDKMRTSASNYEALKELKEYVSDNSDIGYGILTYGDIPGVAYYLRDAECVLSHSWPDLDSYPIADLQEELDKVSGTPLIIMKAESENSSAEESLNDKEILLKEFMQARGYKDEPSFENGKFIVYSTK